VILSGNIDATFSIVTKFAVAAMNGITFDSLVLRIQTNSSVLVEGDLVSGGESELTVEFTRNSTDSKLPLPLLHFGEIQGVPSSELVVEKEGWKQNVSFGGSLQGVMFSVPGNSKFNVSLNQSVEGRSQLCYNGKYEFEVGETEAFFDVVKLCDLKSEGLPLWAILTISIGGSLVVTVVIVICVIQYKKRKAAEQPIVKYTLDESAPEPRKPGCEVF
jgi:hypothetical protein